MTGCRHRLIAACIVALCGPAALAQSADEDLERPVSEGGTYSATFENDIFGGTDRAYTNGIRIDYVTPRNRPAGVARWGRRNLDWLTPADDWYLTFGLGQNIYTPEDISAFVPDPDDRPYAGFLYGSIGIVADSGERLDTLALDIGIVGPAAQGERAQTYVHDLIGAQEPNGWDFQLGNEPGFRLVYERKYRFLYDFEPGLFGLQVDAAPHASLALGNVETSAAAGLTVRIGDRLEDNYGPPRVRPAVAGPGFFESTQGLGWYLFAGAEGRVVGYDMFVQGNLLTDGRTGVDAERLVMDAQVGIALQYRGVELSYTHVFRSPQFEAQESFNTFGSVNLRFRF